MLMNNNLPIILIPGLGTTPCTYSNILTKLWKYGTVSIVNQRQENSLEAIAKRILSEAPLQFVLIGHSMGENIAFEILRQEPERVLKVVFMNTSARADDEEAKKKRKDKIEKVKQGKFPEIIEDSVSSFVHPQHKDSKGLQDIITTAYNDAGAEAYILQQTAIMGRQNSRASLKNIVAPTLVITGDEDMLIPLEHSQEIFAGIAGAKIVIIPMCGHMCTLEQPKLVNEALAEFIGS